MFATQKYPLFGPLCMGLIYLLLGYIHLRNYFHVELYQGTFLMAILVLSHPQRGIYTLRFLYPALLSIILTLLLPVKTGYFLCILFCLFFLVENSLGKLNPAILVILFLLSPVFTFFSNAFGFPIRLALSTTVARILSFTGNPTTANGNLIQQGTTVFSVDQACAGLHMLATSIALSLFTFSYSLKKIRQTPTLLQLGGILLLAFVLNILSNLFRILLLVLFRIPEDQFMHPLIGILCLLLYTIAPCIVVGRLYCKKIAQRLPSSTGKDQPSLPPQTIRYAALQAGLLLSVVLLGNILKNMDQLQKPGTYRDLPGYSHQTLPSGILKYENRESLIYVKATRFYAPEHNPMICWSGSGYTFKTIRKQHIAGKEIYTGLLQKGTGHIYTAWWFESTQIKTIDQLQWRWRALKGEGPFYLVNVSAADPSVLSRETKALLTPF